MADFRYEHGACVSALEIGSPPRPLKRGGSYRAFCCLPLLSWYGGALSFLSRYVPWVRKLDSGLVFVHEFVFAPFLWILSGVAAGLFAQLEVLQEVRRCGPLGAYRPFQRLPRRVDRSWTGGIAPARSPALGQGSAFFEHCLVPAWGRISVRPSPVLRLRARPSTVMPTSCRE